MSGDAGSPPKKMRKDDRLVWVDLEMTGLDESKEEIMEAAVLVTDGDLNIVAEGPNIVLKVSPKVLDNMGEWCQNQHGKSGLTDKCRKSDITLEAAQDQMVQFLEEHAQKCTAPLAGNSIGADKKFLVKYMPKFMNHLHYRVVDVSTVKELCRRWYPEEYAAAPKKAASHRALDDIKDSIKELQYYRSAVFK